MEAGRGHGETLTKYNSIEENYLSTQLLQRSVASKIVRLTAESLSCKAVCAIIHSTGHPGSLQPEEAALKPQGSLFCV
jgi:hypothetical protein